VRRPAINYSKKEEQVYDPVSPDHYKALTGHEPDDVIEAWNLSYRLGSVVAYLARAGSKPGSTRLEDMKKAQWFLSKEILSEGSTEETPKDTP
jgi:hypothetical protein